MLNWALASEISKRCGEPFPRIFLCLAPSIVSLHDTTLCQNILSKLSHFDFTECLTWQLLSATTGK